MLYHSDTSTATQVRVLRVLKATLTQHNQPTLWRQASFPAPSKTTNHPVISNTKTLLGVDALTSLPDDHLGVMRNVIARFSHGLTERFAKETHHLNSILDICYYRPHFFAHTQH